MQGVARHRSTHRGAIRPLIERRMCGTADRRFRVGTWVFLSVGSSRQPGQPGEAHHVQEDRRPLSSHLGHRGPCGLHRRWRRRACQRRLRNLISLGVDPTLRGRHHLFQYQLTLQLVLTRLRADASHAAFGRCPAGNSSRKTISSVAFFSSSFLRSTMGSLK